MELTKKIIKDCLKELRKQQRHYKVYQRYYRGDHDILHTYAFNEERANMKVVVNFFRKFIHDEVSFSLGNPVNFIHKDNEKEVTEAIDLNFSHWQKQHDQKLAIKTATYGFAYELDYINSGGEFKSTVLTPLNCFVLESGNAEKDIELALHIYQENQFSGVEMLDVYFQNKIYTYRIDNIDRITFIQEREHLWSKPPFRVNEYNEERQSMLDDIKSQIDAYSNIVSDLTNEISDFRAAMLVISGAKLENEDAKKMKKSGIIQVDTKADIEYLTKTINDSFVHNQLSNLEEKIYKLASHIDTNEKLQSNLSGAALQSRMISLSNKCSLIQAQMESTIKNRLKNFFRYLRIIESVQHDYRKIKIKHTLNIPHDLGNIADAISKLKDIVPQRTLLSWIPMIENPDYEVELFHKERERLMDGRVDLDNVGVSNPQAGGLDE